MARTKPDELAGFEAVESLELQYIKRRRSDVELSGRDPLKGLALSGGGIRSAVFCLGVLQALASKDLLKHFDYLSTVSGGGYLGAALTWWTNGGSPERQHGVGPETFPWGVEDPATSKPETSVPALLRHLREHGSYLTPGHGLTLWSAVGVVLRGIVLNLLVWLPLTVLVLAACLVPSILWHQTVAIPWDAATHSPPPSGRAVLYPMVYLGLVSAGGILGGVVCLWSMLYSLSTAWEGTGRAQRYTYRRSFEKRAGSLLLLIIAFLSIGTLPYVAYSVHNYVGNAGGPFAFLGGVIGGIYSLVKLPGRDDKQRGAGGIPLPMVAPGAAFLALYGFLLVGWDLASLTAANPGWGYGLLLGFTALALLSGTVVNLNYIGLHRFYRDRLMEAFMPDFGNPPVPVAKAADGARLSSMCEVGTSKGPYHLLNTNLIVTNSKDAKRRVRGRASFLLSPYFCGSDAVGGWIRTTKFLRDGMTLPTAMAISGAAVNPGGASDGIGPTRSQSVAILMALLNIRLGYWVDNPKFGGNVRPNHFRPGWHEFFAASDPENRELMQLSDGGHFEDLGVYELLRRRVPLIIAIDADQDEDFGFDDLQNLLSLAQLDFGAFIDFGNNGLDPLMPSHPVKYPKGLTCCDQAFICGKITYYDETEGYLFYVKAALLKDLRLQLLGYRDADRSFPNDTTLNQFFDEAKFEAYRELGFTIGKRLVADTGFRELVTSSGDKAAQGGGSA